jgi:porin
VDEGDGDEDDVAAGHRAFVIGEVGARWTFPIAALRGRLGVGAWQEPAVSPTIDGKRSRFPAAPFVVFDHDLWRRRPEKDDDATGIGLFAQYGRAARGQGAVVQHRGIGLRWTGALPGRDEDVVGVGVTAIDFAPLGIGTGTGREVAFGPFFKWQAAGWLAVKPDIQWVRNAGGNRSGGYSVATTLRIKIEL